MMEPALSSRLAAPPLASAWSDFVRVMVVDDSALIRGAITRTLEAESDIKVVATASDGALAISALEKNLIDVIVLDIEMPKMDGLTAIPQLLAVAPAVKIIMASTLTLRNADVSLRALSAGAADYVPKPTSIRDVAGAPNFNRELVEKVRHLGAAAKRLGSRRRSIASENSGNRGGSAPLRPTAPSVLTARVPLSLRPISPNRPKIIALGSSTGGPQAVFEVLKSISAPLTQPIVLTQHMPATFTTIFAEHISRQCGIKAVEASDGMPLEAGTVYVARGDHHMTIVPNGKLLPMIKLNQEPAENFCRPAVDPMLRSLISVYGAGILAVILTGMGQDGLKGCDAVVKAGGMIIAQDEATSVVWGMPGAVATSGLCSAVLPLREIGARVLQLANKTA